MKAWTKKLLALTLALVMLLGVLAGCNNDKPVETKPQETQGGNKPAETTPQETKLEGPLPLDYFAGEELTVAVYKAVTDESDNWEDKEIVKMAEEATGIHINWIVVEQAVAAERTAAMLASGELPDIMLGLVDSNTLVANYDLFYDLAQDNLLETYAPNVLADYENGGQHVLEFLKQTDGSIRSLATNAGVAYSSDPGYVWVINTNWLAQLGLEMPTTADEFYNVLCAFRDNDLNGNGDPNDEIPLSFEGLSGDRGFMHLADAFGFNGEDHRNWCYYYKMRDGKVSSTVDTDNFRAFLEYYHKLAAEGLLDVEGFSQTNEQYIAKTSANRVGVMFGWSGANVKADKNQYSYMIPFQGLEDVAPRKTGINGDTYFNCTGFVASAETEKIDVVLHWWNYLSGDLEIQLMCRYGNYYYDEEIGGLNGGFDPAKKDPNVIYPTAYTLSIGNSAPYMGPHEFPNPLKKSDARYNFIMELRDRGMLLEGLGDEVLFDRMLGPEIVLERTMIEADLLPMIDRFIATSVVDGVTDASWEQFKSDLKAYRYYDWLDWLQNYADGTF